MTGKASNANRRKGNCLIIGFVLVAALLWIYWPVFDFGFVNYDDDIYIFNNPYVRAGITVETLRWAFSLNEAVYWHPLTWMSHMMDCMIFGLTAGGHHGTNLMIHILNTLLLFAVFRKMTGRTYLSGIVAALFALHPLNVESVAWVAARKNLLSTTFWMISTLAYAVYVQRPGVLKYLLVLLSFILGLMSKPMIVTLPCVFLLLDFWPLGRVRYSNKETQQWKGFLPGDKKQFVEMIHDLYEKNKHLIFEKVPFFLFTAFSIFISSYAVRRLDIVVTTESVPMPLRVANALVSYIAYMGKMIWPVDLAINYPFPKMIPLWQAWGAAILILGVSLLIVWKAKRHPYLITGWLWYLGTFVPVIGLMQIGFWPAMADRFAYVPFIGLFIMLVWGADSLLSPLRGRHTIAGAIVLVVLATLIPMTRYQLGIWKSSESLFTTAINVTENNVLAHNNLGNIYLRRGQYDRAIQHYRETLRINPDYPLAHNGLGSALFYQQDYDNAISHFKMAVKINPAFQEARVNLKNATGLKLYHEGLTQKAAERPDEAFALFKRAVELNPDYVPAVMELTALHDRNREYDQAMTLLQRVIKRHPNFPDVYYETACLYAQKNMTMKALEFLERALELGYQRRERLKTDPRLESLRRIDRFNQMIETDDKVPPSVKP
jgi:Flp pilus assembly protein TadD